VDARLRISGHDWLLTMPETVHVNPLQLLFIELRVGLARSAIQASLLINGAAAVAVILLLGAVLAASSERGLPLDVPRLKWAIALFGAGLFLAGITFVNAYVAQGALASGQSSAFGIVMRRLGLGLIVGSLLAFLVGLGLVVSAI
jgi:hypothetical protein